MKLNLGCGQNPQNGYVNVDKYGDPEVKWDLEVFPWPWKDNSVEEIRLVHVLEHLGAASDIFLNIMKEMYRVCKPNAEIIIVVPSPRHNDFLNDPTHVRIVTPELMGLFSKKNNLYWKSINAANSPLALYLDVDFEIIHNRYTLAEPWKTDFENHEINDVELSHYVLCFNNVIKEYLIELKVLKNI